MADALRVGLLHATSKVTTDLAFSPVNQSLQSQELSVLYRLIKLTHRFARLLKTVLAMKLLKAREQGLHKTYNPFE